MRVRSLERFGPAKTDADVREREMPVLAAELFLALRTGIGKRLHDELVSHAKISAGDTVFARKDHRAADHRFEFGEIARPALGRDRRTRSTPVTLSPMLRGRNGSPAG